MYCVLYVYSIEVHVTHFVYAVALHVQTKTVTGGFVVKFLRVFLIFDIKTAIELRVVNFYFCQFQLYNTLIYRTSVQICFSKLYCWIHSISVHT